MLLTFLFCFFFFFNDTATTEIYTLSLHDALPIARPALVEPAPRQPLAPGGTPPGARQRRTSGRNRSGIDSTRSAREPRAHGRASRDDLRRCVTCPRQAPGSASSVSATWAGTWRRVSLRPDTPSTARSEAANTPRP